MVTSSDFEQWDEVVHKIARQVNWDYPNLEFDDLKQHLWEILLKYHSKSKLMDLEDIHLESTLRYRGKQYASNQRKEDLIISAQYSYCTSDVRELMNTFFDRNDWESAQVPEDAKSELGNVGVEMSSDLSRAWDRLNTRYKTIILREHVSHNVVDRKERQLLSKAYARLAEIVNSYPYITGNGRRWSISNAEAKVLIDRDHLEDTPEGRRQAYARKLNEGA